MLDTSSDEILLAKLIQDVLAGYSHHPDNKEPGKLETRHPEKRLSVAEAQYQRQVPPTAGGTVAFPSTGRTNSCSKKTAGMKREAMLNVRGPGQGEGFFSGSQVFANGRG